jgi:hypothetical protein
MYIAIQIFCALLFCVSSKKDAVLRQSELRSHVSATLVNFVSKHCRRLVADVETQSIVMSTIKYSSRAY